MVVTFGAMHNTSSPFPFHRPTYICKICFLQCLEEWDGTFFPTLATRENNKVYQSAGFIVLSTLDWHGRKEFVYLNETHKQFVYLTET